MPTSKQKRDAARRHLERQLARRQQRDNRRRQATLLVTTLGVLILIGLGIFAVVGLSHDDKKSTASAGSSASASGSAGPSGSGTASSTPAASKTPGQCTFTAGGTASKKVGLPAAKVPTTGTVSVSVKTNQGPMTLKLDRSKAPCTVASFVSLVSQKYYNDTPCHRLVTSGIYVLQCGDPSGTGSGGPGYTVPDEATGKEAYPAGTVAMARTSSPDSGGSQFFIVYKDSPALAQNLGAQQYTVFGTVSSGLPVVDKVAAAGSDDANGSGDGAPKLKTTIQSMTAS